MKNLAIIFLSLFIIQSISAQTNYQERAEKNLPYLIRNEILLEQITMDDAGVKIYANSSDKAKNKPTVDLKWNNAATYLSQFTKKPVRSKKKGRLSGVKIALDPGHSAHNMETAIIESKFMKISKRDAGTKKDIAFYESELAWKTAYILAKRLEKKGATVLVTRKKGKNSFGYNFDQWKKKRFKEELTVDLQNKEINRDQYNWYLTKAKNRDIHRYMNRKDMEYRAVLINNFQPTLTINIHYNATTDKTDAQGNFPAIANNYCMAFTGGGFMTGELQSKDQMEDFLRLLISEDLENSIAFSAEVIKYHQCITKVPITPNKNNVRYLQNNSVYADQPGIYCRNLGMTRRVRGTICFGESLMQDNINEAVLLNMKNYKESRMRTSSRVKLVVDAYELGILSYLSK
ncbi:MAG: N-acetylmuramoyl-L-alanine amidase [Maribacter sp.]|jgi:N-acetylmuramoyl-L-alanine amidase